MRNALLHPTQAPVVKLGATAATVLRLLRSGCHVTSINGSDWRCACDRFTETCIDGLLEAGLVRAVQCGPDKLLALHLELTDAYWQAQRPTPVNPWGSSDYAPVYEAMHRLNRYAIRELTGHEQRNLLDAVQNAMNRTADGDKLRALSGIEREIGLVTA